MISDMLAELLKLPPADRADIALALWESLDDAEREAEFPISPELREDLDREMEEHLRDPESAIPWESVLRKLKSRD